MPRSSSSAVRDRDRDVATVRTHRDGPADQIVVPEDAIEPTAALETDVERLGLQQRLRHGATKGQHPECLLQRRLRDARGVADADAGDRPIRGPKLARTDELRDQRDLMHGSTLDGPPVPRPGGDQCGQGIDHVAGAQSSSAGDNRSPTSSDATPTLTT